MDVNGDGRPDFVTGGWWGNTIRWRENPGQAGKPWPEHVIAEVGSVETTRGWDIDGDSDNAAAGETMNDVVAFLEAQGAANSR